MRWRRLGPGRAGLDARAAAGGAEGEGPGERSSLVLPTGVPPPEAAQAADADADDHQDDESDDACRDKERERLEWRDVDMLNGDREQLQGREVDILNRGRVRVRRNEH